jgi:hypothetical protein
LRLRPSASRVKSGFSGCICTHISNLPHKFSQDDN